MLDCLIYNSDKYLGSASVSGIEYPREPRVRPSVYLKTGKIKLSLLERSRNIAAEDHRYR
jgi:hypothetical protein